MSAQPIETTRPVTHLELAMRQLDVAHGGQQCRVCGCTDSSACPGGCYWVQSDLCSSCADRELVQ